MVKDHSDSEKGNPLPTAPKRVRMFYSLTSLACLEEEQFWLSTKTGAVDAIERTNDFILIYQFPIHTIYTLALSMRQDDQNEAVEQCVVFFAEVGNLFLDFLEIETKRGVLFEVTLPAFKHVKIQFS